MPTVRQHPLQSLLNDRLSVRLRAPSQAVNRSLELARQGEVLPVYGTCLGFQWVCQIIGDIELTGGYDAENFSIPLDLDEGASTSRLLGDMDEMRGWLATEASRECTYQRNNQPLYAMLLTSPSPHACRCP